MPRIYVADLAEYNAGHLVGEWIELDDTDTAEDLAEKIRAFILLPTHEEWAIHDYEGFGPIRIGEYDSLETIVKHVENMGDEPGKYFAWIADRGEAEGFDPDMVFGPYESPDQWLDEAISNEFGTLDLEDILTKAGIGHLYHYIEWRDAESYQRNVTGSETGILTRVEVDPTGSYRVDWYEVAE
jgi:antirestriction protein